MCLEALSHALDLGNVEVTFSWPEVAGSKTANMSSPRASIST